jgi:hypothetical protein
VHGEEVQADIKRIETMVIVDDGSASQPSTRDWGNALAIEAEVSIDLHVDPYVVMLRPDGVPNDAAVWVSALAYDGNDELVGWGQLDRMVKFSPDLVLRFEMHLHGAQIAGDGCVVKDGTVVIRGTDDCDEDGFDFTVDCDDLDELIAGDLDGDPVVCDPDCDQESGEIYPGAEEECDGLDNDCDPLTRAPPRLCVDVAREGDTIVECSIGEQICNDTTDGGAYGLCVGAPIDTTANNELCHVWADCLATAGEDNIEDCILDGRMRCQVPQSDAGIACLPSVTEQKLQDLFQISGCTWRLIGNIQQGPWNVGLRQHASNNTIAGFYNACDAELVVTESGTVPHAILLQADTPTETLAFAVILDPRRAGCDPQLTPSHLECEPL